MRAHKKMYSLKMTTLEVHIMEIGRLYTNVIDIITSFTDQCLITKKMSYSVL